MPRTGPLAANSLRIRRPRSRDWENDGCVMALHHINTRSRYSNSALTILGAILFFLLQDWFAQYGAWYLIGLGAVAIAFALFLPRALWSLADDRLPFRLLPV